MPSWPKANESWKVNSWQQMWSVWVSGHTTALKWRVRGCCQLFLPTWPMGPGSWHLNRMQFSCSSLQRLQAAGFVLSVCSAPPSKEYLLFYQKLSKPPLWSFLHSLERCSGGDIQAAPQDHGCPALAASSCCKAQNTCSMVTAWECQLREVKHYHPHWMCDRNRSKKEYVIALIVS